MNSRFSPLTLLVAAMLISLVARGGAAWWWQERQTEESYFAFPDSNSYWTLAGCIANGEPYEYGSENRVFRTPGYPLLLAPVRMIGANFADEGVFLARMLGVLLGVCTVALVALLTGRLFGMKAAVVAAIFAALYPGAIAMSIFVLAEAAFCPLMLGQLILWLEAARSENLKRAFLFAALAGVLAGCAILVRPSWLLFTPFAIGIAVIACRNRGRQVAVGVTMLLLCATTMSPWWVRNYRVTGKFVPTTLQVGASLYDGLSKRADGSSDMSYVDEFRLQQRLEDKRTGAEPDGFEARLDDRMKQAAIDWAKENPGRVFGLALVKLGRMWSVTPNFSEFQSWPMRLSVLLGFTPLALLAVVGIAKFVKLGWPVALCYLPAVYFTLLHMVFVGSIRYRQPPMLVLIALAAAGFVYVVWPRLVGSKPPELPAS